METNKDFSILHENTSVGQFLVDTTFDHDNDLHVLTFKFWFAYINGYTTMTLTWTKEQESKYKETFEKLKDPEFCESWIAKIRQDFEFDNQYK